MSPAQALVALHRAGRIQSPWLPGMSTDTGLRVTDTRHDGYPGLVRVAHDEGIEWVAPGGVAGRVGGQPCDLGSPDLSDPATVGCLLALLREATGDPRIHVALMDSGEWAVWETATELGVVWNCPVGWWGSTEGEAIAAALIALAEAP